MRQPVLLLASMALAVLLASGVGLAATEPIGEADANCVFVSNAVYGASAPLAQTFVAEKSGKLRSVMLDGGTTEDGRVDIAAVNSLGLPTDDVLASTPVTAESAGEDYWTTVNFDYGSAASVVAGKKYALVLHASGKGWEASSSNRCQNGEFYERWSTGWRLFNGSASYDAVYRTFVSPPDTIAPTGLVKINDDARRTKTRTVTLTLDATDPSPGYWEPASGIDSMRIKTVGGSWTAWQSYATSKGWKLTRGAGKKMVYAQYRDAAGNLSAQVSDSITYRP